MYRYLRLLHATLGISGAYLLAFVLSGLVKWQDIFFTLKPTAWLYGAIALGMGFITALLSLLRNRRRIRR